MKNVLRVLSLLCLGFALYGGFASGDWSFTAGIMFFALLLFLGSVSTVKATGITKDTRSAANSSGIIGSTFVAGDSGGSCDGGGC